MDNTSSHPQIIVPELPFDFESRVGSSKTSFAREILELVARSQIVGIQSEVADIASLQARVTALETQGGIDSKALTDLTTVTTDHEKRLDAAELKLTNHAARITGVETENLDQVAQIENHTARLDTQRADIDAHTAELAGMTHP